MCGAVRKSILISFSSEAAVSKDGFRKQKLASKAVFQTESNTYSVLSPTPKLLLPKESPRLVGV